MVTKGYCSSLQRKISWSGLHSSYLKSQYWRGKEIEICCQSDIILFLFPAKKLKHKAHFPSLILLAVSCSFLSLLTNANLAVKHHLWAMHPAGLNAAWSNTSRSQKSLCSVEGTELISLRGSKKQLGAVCINLGLSGCGKFIEGCMPTCWCWAAAYNDGCKPGVLERTEKLKGYLTACVIEN